MAMPVVLPRLIHGSHNIPAGSTFTVVSHFCCQTATLLVHLQLSRTPRPPLPPTAPAGHASASTSASRGFMHGDYSGNPFAIWWPSWIYTVVAAAGRGSLDYLLSMN